MSSVDGRRVRSWLVLASCVAFTACLTTTFATPLAAQTGDTATNLRTHDFNRATQRDTSTPGQRAYETALGYVNRIRSLETKRESGEELSAREQKKLDKAYEKALAGLTEAVEEAPAWVEPRLTLGALHYNRGEYDAALDAFQGVLDVEPEHQAALDFRRMCEEEIAASEGSAP